MSSAANRAVNKRYVDSVFGAFVEFRRIAVVFAGSGISIEEYVVPVQAFMERLPVLHEYVDSGKLLAPVNASCVAMTVVGAGDKDDGNTGLRCSSECRLHLRDQFGRRIK